MTFTAKRPLLSFGSEREVSKLIVAHSCQLLKPT